MATIAPAELVARIWERDPTVWTGRDEAQWLGWLEVDGFGRLVRARAAADFAVLRERGRRVVRVRMEGT